MAKLRKTLDVLQCRAVLSEAAILYSKCQFLSDSSRVYPSIHSVDLHEHGPR